MGVIKTATELLNAQAYARLKAVFDHPYQKNTCFLCASELKDDNWADEHVVPRWLQERYHLWNKRIVLLNGTDFPYRQLTIPCCFSCNNLTLAPIEKSVSTAFASGVDAVRKIPPCDLFRWLAKVFLGLQYKELFLAADRASPEEGMILDSAYVQRYAILHLLLQMTSLATQTRYSPCSIWIFPAQVPSEVEYQFDFKDSVKYGVIALRIGDVAVFADLLENGVHAQISQDVFAPIANNPLHPAQFVELFAKIVYAATRIRQETKVEFLNSDGQFRIAINWFPTTISGGTMDPWIQADYAAMLSEVVGRPITDVYFPPDRVMSWLYDPTGKPVYWELGKPFPVPWNGPSPPPS